jgi:hypothetical protein
MARGKKTISQRIALDGGAEIEKEFKALGKAGEEAFEQIKRSLEQTSGPFQNFPRMSPTCAATWHQ